ncbi:hypothetical protein O181_078266 [Austropuccinia psidii MF-1]|uniref:Uncharacterized protein n=1 Tax=Austropuccinia psidii MF-1 TaxID=1389203 RepID=A0A9Q3FJP5_9BASI|nr:hypothetical protein [Austropuccinia psidii MF-1]
MSSSKPHKSHSGFVHDSDSESSIKYVQTQSPRSPNIPLTTPIASSMNVSGPNIDVGNLMAPTSSTWSIPNISITPIPLNPTNTQMHEFMSQEPFGKNKRPTLNVPSGSQVHVGNEKWFDGGNKQDHCKMLLIVIWHLKASDELYASLPLVHKEKLTACHNPYSSKPGTAHATSSREKIMDDEDENMSLSHSEANDYPRRALSQIIRQQRSQDCKTPNVAKHVSQKEQQRWLKSELPENVHGMRSAVHAHCLFLLKVRDKDCSSLPAPLSTEECEIAIKVAGHLRYVPKDVFNEP